MLRGKLVQWSGKVIIASGLGLMFVTGSYADKTYLEEVVVTAQKRDENITDVPISITQLNGDRMNARFAGGGDIMELRSAVPGLHIESSNGRGAPRFYLRGLGNADFTAAASQPVTVIFDDVPVELSTLRAFPVFDMESIEVARGPQGTLFGRNTTAGFVHVKSALPTEEFEGYINVQSGTYDTLNFEGAVSGTLIEDKLMGRLSVLNQNRGDWVNNPILGTKLNSHDILAARIQFLWTPKDDVKVLLSHKQENSERGGSLFRANVIDTGTNELNENYQRDVVFHDSGKGRPTADAPGGDGGRNSARQLGTTLKVDWELSDHTFTSITAYLRTLEYFARGDIDGGFGCLFTCPGRPAGPASSPFSPFNSPFVVNIDTGGDRDVTQFTQEIRIASNLDGPLNYQFGGIYFDDKLISISNSQNAGATAFTSNSINTIENTSWAVFGQASYDFSDQLTLTGGLRYSDDEKDADPIDLTGAIATVPISLADEFLSFDVSLSYDWSESTQTYVRAASGFRAPSIQDRIQDDTEVTTAGSEEIISYEIGIKGEAERFRYSLAVFSYKVDDMQLVAIGGESNSTTLLNAEEGKAHGFEAEIEYAVTENLIISAGFGYADTEIGDPSLSLPPGPLTTPLDPLTPEGNALIDGNPFQHAPEWTGNLEIAYSYPLSDGNELYVFTDWRWKGETSDFLYQSIEYTFDTQFEGGLRIGYRNLSSDLEIGFFGRNITDEDNLIGGIDFANNTGYVNEPRIWGAEIKLGF